MQRGSFHWWALVVIGLAGIVAVSAAATALAARSAASPFELVVQGRAVDVILDGTFTSSGPFCESGTAAHAPHSGEYRELYTCSDGSGSLTFRFTSPTGWTIVEGSGRYGSLRGKGTYDVDTLALGDSATWEFRAKLQGFVDADAVAPTLAFTSASATRQRRTPGAYTVRVAFSLRDDIDGNTVSYRLSVGGDPWAVASGSTASGSASATLLVFPSSKRARSVQLQLTGSDPLGNEVSITRSLKLPRS